MNDYKFPISSTPKNVIILRSGEIDHLRSILDSINQIGKDIQITCVVQKEFETVALVEKRISKIITLKKLGDFSFKFSLPALIEIRKYHFDLAIVMEREGNEWRDRRTHLLAFLIKANQKLISISNGSFKEFHFHLPLVNLPEVLLSNILSFADITLAKLINLILILILPILKYLKKFEFDKKNNR